MRHDGVDDVQPLVSKTTASERHDVFTQRKLEVRVKNKARLSIIHICQSISDNDANGKILRPAMGLGFSDQQAKEASQSQRDFHGKVC